MSDLLLLVRLALATGVVLAPGWLVARALGVRSAAATLAWGLAAIFAAMTVTFAVHGSLTLTLVLLALVAVVAGVVLRFPGLPAEAAVPRRRAVAAVGVVVGLLLWHVAGAIGGDGLFHLARVRKLDDLGGLHLSTVNEFPDGGLHPGYAFPLWHGFLALVAKVALVDPADVVLHEPSVLAPVALVVTYEAGYALFRAASPAAAAVAAQVALTAFAPGHGGAYTALALPATAARQILVPAALALALLFVRRPSASLLATTAAAGGVLVVVHPTYALFLLLPFGGFLVVRWLWTRGEARSIALALAALGVPAALFVVWLLPVVRATASHDPGSGELRRALAQYAGQLDVRSQTSYSLAAQVLGRGGAVAVAALLLVPLAGLASRRRWAAFVVGGSLAVLVVCLTPWLFTPLSDAVSLSQSRRAAGFLPFAFAFAGGLGVLAGLIRAAVLPAAFVAGIVLQREWPGDFGYRLQHGGPALVTWIALAGAVAALVVGLVRRVDIERGGGLAAALFLLPVTVHGLWHWSPSPLRQPSPLTPGLVSALHHEVPAGATIYSDLESSYRIAAAAPVYICNAPPGHVADTRQNRPYARRAAARRFFRTGELGVPRRCGASWLVVDRSRFGLRPSLPVAYRDGRYTLYRL